MSRVTALTEHFGIAEDDRRLIDRCLTAEPGAWEDFLRLYRRTLSGAVRSVLHRSRWMAQEEDVDNVVQDVVLALYEDSFRRLRSFQGQCSLAGWLRSVATNHTLNFIRFERMRRGRSLDADPLLIPEAPPDANAPSEDDVERLQSVRARMDDLPPRDRLALQLHYFDGMPQKEIARILRVSENTIWPLVSRARKKLQDLLGPQ